MYQCAGRSRFGSPYFICIVIGLALLSAGSVVTRAVDIAWTNISGGVWSAAANWSPNNVPGASDNAYITNAGTYTVTLDTSPTLAALRIGGNSGTQTLANPSQTLTLNGPGLLETNTIFNLSGGTLDGTGQLLVKGVFNWSGGVMDSTSGGGKTVFTNSATVSITTGSTKFFYRRTVDNYTTVTWNGGAIYAGGSCTWNNKGGALFDIAGDLTWLLAIAGNPVFNNDGTLRKSAGSGTSSFQAYVANNNLVSAQSGVLDLPISYVQSAGLTELAGGNFSGVLLDIQGRLAHRRRQHRGQRQQWRAGRTGQRHWIADNL